MSDYETVRQFADSYALAAMLGIFAIFILWTLRPGGRRHYDEAATMIFTEDQDGQGTSEDKRHG